MNDGDKKRFMGELTLTLQTVSGVIRPPLEVIKAFYVALEDLPADKVIPAIVKYRKVSRGWPAPVVLRELVEGAPHLDEFLRFMNQFVAMGKSGYDHPIGTEVVKAMGGSRRFRESTNFERADLQRTWIKLFKEIAANGRT
jgi:hypothetical protein